MECPRGSTCSESSHIVKTLDKAKEWMADVTTDQLPITVYQRTSSSGRTLARFFDKDSKYIGFRG